MKKILYTIVFVFIFSIGFSKESAYNKTIETQTHGIKIQIIPKLELFQIMAYLSNSLNQNKLDFEYKAEITKYFEPFKNDNSLLFLNKVLRNYHAQPLISGLFLNKEFSKDSSLLKFLDLSDFGLNNTTANKVIILDSLVKVVDLYAEITNFESFVLSHELYYQQKIDEVKTAISNVDIIKYNENFWGLKKESYKFVICLLDNEIHSYWFHDNNNSNCVFFLTPKFVINNDATFGNANLSNIREGKMSAQDYIFYGAGHELGHCFFNPIADKLTNDIDKIGFKISTSDPSKNAFLCESMLRSLTAYYMIENNYSEIAQMVIQMEKSQGYIYNDILLDLIKDYSANRTIYNSFNDYVPVLISKLNQQIK